MRDGDGEMLTAPIRTELRGWIKSRTTVTTAMGVLPGACYQMQLSGGKVIDLVDALFRDRVGQTIRVVVEEVRP